MPTADPAVERANELLDRLKQRGIEDGAPSWMIEPLEEPMVQAQVICAVRGGKKISICKNCGRPGIEDDEYDGYHFTSEGGFFGSRGCRAASFRYEEGGWRDEVPSSTFFKAVTPKTRTTHNSNRCRDDQVDEDRAPLKKMRAGRERKAAKLAEEGRTYAWTFAPYGYRRTADGALEPDPRSDAPRVAAYVRRLRSTGWTLRRVAERLNERAVPTPSGSGRWHPTTVSRIAANAP